MSMNFIQNPEGTYQNPWKNEELKNLNLCVYDFQGFDIKRRKRNGTKNTQSKKFKFCS